jgi:hypothetical protein
MPFVPGEMVLPLGRAIILWYVVLPFSVLCQCIISDFESSNHTALILAHFKAIFAAAFRHCTLYAFYLI